MLPSPRECDLSQPRFGPRKIKKNVIYFGTLFSASSRWEQKGVTSAKTPPTGIANKSACRWSGGREKMHERKMIRSVVTLADWAGERVGRRYAEIMTQHDLRCCYGHCYWRGFSLGNRIGPYFFTRPKSSSVKIWTKTLKIVCFKCLLTYISTKWETHTNKCCQHGYLEESRVIWQLDSDRSSCLLDPWSRCMQTLLGPPSSPCSSGHFCLFWNSCGATLSTACVAMLPSECKKCFTRESKEQRSTFPVLHKGRGSIQELL